MFYLSKLFFKDNICKDDYFYFILLCRVLVSVSWKFAVSRHVVSPWPYPCPCFLGFAHASSPNYGDDVEAKRFLLTTPTQ